MSSEERWLRIENALQTVAEGQGQHDAQIRNLIAHGQETDRRLGDLTENVATLAQNMILLVHKVDDLSDISRSHEGRIEELSSKIDILVDTVDRIIRRDHK